MALLLTACQQFTLLDEIRLKSDETSNTEDDATDEETEAPPLTQLTLELERVRVNFTETIELYPAGGTPPYSYSIEEVDLFYKDPGGNLGSFTGNTYTAWKSVGKVNIVLEDSGTFVVKKALTLRPPAPHTLAGSKYDSITAEIEWIFSELEEMIDGFIITSVNSDNIESKINVGRDTRNYQDKHGSETGSFTYSIQSTANGMVSLPTDPITVHMAP
ncbi:MAG: hypothetical protein PQJ58_00425 [Spirochaetales bacterium]|nr:hypothetical protein [Spirochaetales bacterium]